MIVDLEHSKEPTTDCTIEIKNDFNKMNKKTSYKMKIKHQYLFSIPAISPQKIEIEKVDSINLAAKIIKYL